MSKIRFNADSAFAASQITLHVSSRVKSYANVAMQSDYIQTFAIEQEISKILCDSIVYVPYGRDMAVRVSAVPVTAAAGKTLRINSVSPEFLSISADSAVLDASGAASFTVHGNLPGMTSLHYSIDDYDKTAYSTVSITRNSCNPVYTSEDTNVCDQFSYGDSIYHNSCTIRNVYTAASGCDSIHSIHLTVHHSVQNPISATICNGQSFLFGQTNLTSPGVYTDTLQTSNQCDSIITLTLTVNSTSAFTDQVVACDSLEWHGTVYTASNNTATFTTQNINGCDSVITLNLTLNHSNAAIDEISTCDSLVWIDGVTYITSNHTATYILQNSVGCDSTVSLNLTIRPNYTITFNGNGGVGEMLPMTSCSGITTLLPHCTFTKEQYFFAGWSLESDGTVVYTDVDTITLNNNLILYAVWSTTCVTAYSTTLETVCDSMHWRNDYYYISGTYHDTAAGVNLGGCDSIYILHLTVNHSNTGTDVQTACDTYTWHGTTYTASTNTPTFTEQNVEGCDSVVTLHLTINHSNTGTDVQTACDTYTWHGTTYTASTNTPTFTEQNAAGCDSVVTLHLTINHSNTGTDEQTACDTYTWHGTTYTASTNTPTFTEQNVEGCDSVVTLHLTVNHSDSTVFTTTACDSLLWHGSVYVSSTETPVFVTQNSVGCDSVVTLHLTINNSTTSVFDLADCDSVVWSDWTFYTSTDTTIVLTNSVGCDSLNILHLSVNYTAQTTTVDSAQGSYDWNGLTYTESGEYVFTSQTEAGCDSIVTLILTITQTEGILFDGFEQVTLYPNPTTGKFVINGMKVTRLEVYDLDGRLVDTFINTNSFDISQLSSGTYLVRIILPQGETIRRVIKH